MRSKRIGTASMIGAVVAIVVIGVLIITAFFVLPEIFEGQGEAPSEGEGEAPSEGGTSINIRAPLPDAPEVAKGYIMPNDSTVQTTLSYIIANKPWHRTEFGAIQEWITSNITYAYDSTVHGKTEYFQYSSETITLRTGDCEDYAILFCTLLRAYGVPADSVYVVVGYGSSGGHAWLAECYRYGYWRYIEPQVDGNWFFHEDEAAASAHVYLYPDLCYFNDQTFTKTKPFILPSEAGEATITSAYWEVDGQIVTTAQTGDNVGAKVVLKAQGGPISGTCKIVVRKDIAWWIDEDYAWDSTSVGISSGDSETWSLSWSPSEASGGSLRGYFIEVWFEDEKIYTMDSSYPPRLTVI